jgi:predicted phage-related endonuclease
VAEAYAEDYTKAVVAWPVILVSQEEEHPFMLANVDFFIVESSEEFPEGQVTTWRSESEPPGIKGILEVKTAGIASPGAPHLWSNNAIPQSYMLQAIHYGIVTGIYDITFAALIGGQGLITRELEWDDEIAENLIIAEGQFWDLLQNEIPPATDGSDATEAAQQSRYPRHTPGKGYEGGPEFLELWSRYNAAKEASDAADAERKSFRAEIIELIGDSEFATVNGKTVLTYRASKDSEALDIDRIKREAPEIWERFKKVRSGARIMRAVNK